jgi:hypothetical protein
MHMATTSFLSITSSSKDIMTSCKFELLICLWKGDRLFMLDSS